jgi:Leucine-rich repeat (LRR) protein
MGFGQAMAQDCLSSIINLRKQADVDAFQATWGPCTRVSIDLNIEQFDAEGDDIVDLTPLSGLTEVGNILFIGGNPALASLAGLENLASVHDFRIVYNPSLNSLAGLAGLVSSHFLLIEENPSLASLNGLASLTNVSRLTLIGVPVNGLPGSLVALDRLALGNNPGPDLQGLPPTLTQVRELSIGNQVNLVSLDGLPAFTGLESVTISENDGLNDLSALANSTWTLAAPAETAISVTFNWGLTHLGGLPSMARLGWLEVWENYQLETLSGLDALQEIWDGAYIVGNPALRDCSILATALDAVDDGDPGPGSGIDPDDPPDTPGLDYITITDNFYDPDAIGDGLPFCNSVADVLAGGGDTIHADGFEGG